MQFKQSRIENFVKEIRGRKNVYCFGAGTVLTKFLHEFQEYKVEEDIKYVVDNSRKKQGTLVQGIRNSILVISLEQMLHEITLEDVILITTVHFPEIIELLDRVEKLKNTKCYLYNILGIEQYDYDRLNITIPKNLSVYQERQIPKVIHYCWFGGGQIPDQYRVWMDSWKKYCPDYEIIEWNEKNYDVKKNKYLCQAYERKKWAFVSDYARIDIIYEYGGVYLDTDVELIRNIDVLLMNDAFCGFESKQYVAYGLGFGARRHYQLLGEIKKFYDDTNFISEDGTFNQVNCPMIQTEIMKKHGLKCNGEFQVVAGMTVYPPMILSGMSPYSFRILRDLSHTYSIHHFAGSWVGNMNWKNNIIEYMKSFGRNDNYFYAG